MWELRRLRTLWASTACSFTFHFLRYEWLASFKCHLKKSEVFLPAQRANDLAVLRIFWFEFRPKHSISWLCSHLPHPPPVSLANSGTVYIQRKLLIIPYQAASVDTGPRWVVERWQYRLVLKRYSFRISARNPVILTFFVIFLNNSGKYRGSTSTGSRPLLIESLSIQQVYHFALFIPETNTLGRRLTTDLRSDWHVVSRYCRMSAIFLLTVFFKR
jgi:hypothetical protein